MNGDDREMTLTEWCEKLPLFHAVNQDLLVLKHCREHPVQWAVWDFVRKYIPWIPLKNPYDRSTGI